MIKINSNQHTSLEEEGEERGDKQFFPDPPCPKEKELLTGSRGCIEWSFNKQGKGKEQA